MKRLTFVVSGIFLIGLGAATAAYAGSRSSNNAIKIDVGARTITGALSDARNSGDNVSWLACDISVAEGDQAVKVGVYAKDEWGEYAYCTSSNPLFVQTALGLQADALVSVSYDAHNKCTQIWTSRASHYAPKQP